LGAAERPLVPVIVGPTGVGKTAVAAALAALQPITVISADARQVYRGLDIGTAKPAAAILARVPHLGIDLVEPGQRYSAGQFARDAAGWLEQAQRDGRRAVVVGGTGFYVRALAEGLFHEPPFDPAQRERMRAWTGALESGVLARWAARLDRAYRGGGRQRAARALEVALLTGRSLSWWQREARASGVMRPWYIHLTLPREALRRRIAERVAGMLAAGLVAETSGMLARGVPADAAGFDAIGYREAAAMLAGRLPEAQLGEAIARATSQYAKRQETWFRNQLTAVSDQPSAVWKLDATQAPGELAAMIHAQWNTLTAEGRHP
jgi:tRNA dimethylallyltransferase